MPDASQEIAISSRKMWPKQPLTQHIPLDCDAESSFEIPLLFAEVLRVTLQ
jgi:hypothetical protein